MRMLITILLLGGLALSVPGSAQEEAAETPSESATPLAQGQGEAADAGDEEADDDFVFSEEVPAETQLVFPVDI